MILPYCLKKDTNFQKPTTDNPQQILLDSNINPYF
jgi:hypothetical protein